MPEEHWDPWVNTFCFGSIYYWKLWRWSKDMRSHSGRSLVRLKCWSGGPEIGGSNPLAPTQKPDSIVSGFFIWTCRSSLRSTVQIKKTKIDKVNLEASHVSNYPIEDHRTPGGNPELIWAHSNSKKENLDELKNNSWVRGIGLKRKRSMPHTQHWPSSTQKYFV